MVQKLCVALKPSYISRETGQLYIVDSEKNMHRYTYMLLQWVRENTGELSEATGYYSEERENAEMRFLVGGGLSVAGPFSS